MLLLKTKFKDFAFEIDDASHRNAENVYRVLESFSTSITSIALDHESTWPNITVPHFEVRGDRFRAAIDARLVSFCPIVTDVEEWNDYSVEHQAWMAESYEWRGEEDSPDPIPTQVYRVLEGGTMVPEQDKVEYCPLWQQSEAPNDTSVINFNLLSHDIFGRVFDLMRYFKAPVLSQAFDPSTLLGSGARLDTDHPESILVHPVFAEFDYTTVVGAVIAVIPWDTYFSDLLHYGANGVICVIVDTCGDDFTYRVDGPRATYLGKGDLHNPKYDFLEHVAAVDFSKSQEVDGEGNHCGYTLHLFPAEDLEQEYYTNLPGIFCAFVFLIFLFTSAVFMIYDFLVQKRQDKVHSAAMKTNAIVSSLFPAEIRDRLFQHNDSQRKFLLERRRARVPASRAWGTTLTLAWICSQKRLQVSNFMIPSRSQTSSRIQRSCLQISLVSLPGVL
jgi:hypothetical protein